MVAVGGHLQGDHGGGGAPVHQALVQHVVHRLPLPAPADPDWHSGCLRWDLLNDGLWCFECPFQTVVHRLPPPAPSAEIDEELPLHMRAAALNCVSSSVPVQPVMPSPQKCCGRCAAKQPAPRCEPTCRCIQARKTQPAAVDVASNMCTQQGRGGGGSQEDLAALAGAQGAEDGRLVGAQHPRQRILEVIHVVRRQEPCTKAPACFRTTSSHKRHTAHVRDGSAHAARASDSCAVS